MTKQTKQEWLRQEVEKLNIINANPYRIQGMLERSVRIKLESHINERCDREPLDFSVSIKELKQLIKIAEQYKEME